MSEFRRRLIAQGEKKVNQFIATYNVTSTSSQTRLLGEKFNASQIDKMYIDDVEVALTKLYTFTTTGEHKVKCLMNNNFTSCERMFHGCPIKYLDCTNFDLSKVTTVKFMFYQNNQSAIGGLTDLNTSNVENFASIFNACQKMGYINISNWNLKGNCSQMFAYDVALGQVVSSADISNVLNFDNAFVTCLKLKAIPNFIGWKQGNLSFSNSASISAVSIHNLINNAKSVADGAIARTLTLNATAKTKWQNSEYFYSDYLMLEEKNITISGLTITTINIPEGVTTIPDNVFSELTSLTSVTIPEGVSTIGNNAFANCTSLTSVTIPSTVTYIGNNAFSGCVNISEITMKPTNAPTLGENVWGDNESNYVGSNVSNDKYVFIKDEYIGYDTDKWNMLLEECGFTRPTFVKISYLESYLDSSNSNGQYINTERLINSTDIMELIMEIIPYENQDKATFGWRWTGSVTTGNQCYINAVPDGFSIRYGNSKMETTVYELRKSNIVFNPNEKKVTINGTIVLDETNIDFTKPYNSNGNSQVPLFLFTANNKGTPFSGSACRIYEYKLSDKDGNILQHLIPALDGNNRPCMYDTVSGKFHYNQRTNRTDDFRYA